MKNKKILSELLFWLHLPIVIIWFGLFLVPSSLWAGKVAFHFWFIVSIMFIQLLWSLVVFRRFEITCPITTWMQYLRGHSLKSKKNFNHSYIAELGRKLHLPMNYKAVNILLMITLILVSVQYLFHKLYN